MSKKTQFTRSKAKIGSLSWTSPIYTHGEGKYQNKILHDNIPGYPGYHISKRGRIYSRWDVNGKGILNKRYHLKQPHLNKNGRYVVGLSQPGIGKKNWLVHRLVALVYLPNPEGLPYVCHKDNVPRHNNVSNLYWGTPSENTQQCIRDGRGYIGDKNPRAKVKNLDREIIRRKYTLGLTINELTREYNLSRSAIRKILYLSI